MIDMSRKDDKGRNLNKGESQRADGRYMYRYTDELTGERKVIYDKDLISLRQKEKKITKDMEDLINTDSKCKKITLNELFESYMETKELRNKTRNNYLSLWNNRVKNSLGQMKIIQIKPSHIKKFYSKLSREGLSHSTIKAYHCMILPSLAMAVDDNIIRKNPAEGTLENYGAPPKEKKALTLSQQNKLLQFVENSNVYRIHLPMMQIMFGACLRVGEAIGLTWADVDLENRSIHINGQLVYHDAGEGYSFHVSETKTDAGERYIPMTQVVYDAFINQKKINEFLEIDKNIQIGEKKDFIFLTKQGRPIMPAGVNSYLKNIVDAYNKKEKELARLEGRKPDLMPHISAHTLRHSGCTRMGENNISPKVMQYIMGHSDPDITMGVYNHIAEQRYVEEEMSKMDMKYAI